MSHPLHRCTLRFERTADAAFRTPRYAAAIHYTRAPLWRRIAPLAAWLLVSGIAFILACVLVAAKACWEKC